MPIICSQCKVPMCADACPVEALKRADGVVSLNTDECISCMKCVEACPFGAMYAHNDVEHPIKCDLCDGLEEPQCVKYCYTEALQYLPDERVGITLARAKSEKYLEIATQEV